MLSDSVERDTTWVWQDSSVLITGTNNSDSVGHRYKLGGSGPLTSDSASEWRQGVTLWCKMVIKERIGALSGDQSKVSQWRHWKKSIENTQDWTSCSTCSVIPSANPPPPGRRLVHPLGSPALADGQHMFLCFSFALMMSKFAMKTTNHLCGISSSLDFTWVVTFLRGDLRWPLGATDAARVETVKCRGVNFQTVCFLT